MSRVSKILRHLSDWFLSVPVRIKIMGMMILPVLILGLGLNYWIQVGLSDWLSFLLSDARVQIAMQAGSRSVMFVTVLAAIASLLLTYLLMVILTQPLLELHKTAASVAGGDLESRARVHSEDEIGEVAQSMNRMIDHLVSSQQDLARNNRRLEITNQVAMAVTQEDDIHDVLYRVLKTIIEALNLETGWVYLRDPEREALHLASWYGAPQAAQDALLHSAIDEPCGCQQKLIQGELTLEPQMYPCKRLDGTICQPCQHLTIKLETQSQQFGTINILLDQPLPDEDLALLTLIGSQISEIVSNAWLRLKLAEKESARQALLSALVKAQEDERARLAHELHDGAGQTLTSLLLRLKSLEKKAPDEKFRLAILNVCDTFSETIETVREISHQLRPVILEELGLETALKSLLNQMATQIGLEVDFDYQLPDEMISDDLEATLYRVVQEALTNITRHARASRIRLQLLADEEALHLYIEDNGVGFDPEQEALRDGRGRFGLLGMQERVEVLGGSFEVFTAPEQGTCITVLVPWILAGIA